MTFRLMTIVFLAILLAGKSMAEDVSLTSLGALRLSYQQAEPVSSYPGQRIVAEVSYKKGAAYSLLAPSRVQQITYLVEIGSTVKRGQPFAELRGPEMHHFVLEMEVARKMFKIAERRFKSNQSLYAKGAIKESQWVEVSEQYYTAQLEYEHMRHFNDLIISTDEKTDSMTVAAPIDGLVDYTLEDNSINSGDEIAVFIPLSGVRLKAQIATSDRTGLMYFETDSCRLSVSSIGAVASGFFVTAWSESVNATCNFILGQRFLATPFYQTVAYRVPDSALFQWQSAAAIFIKQGAQLRVVEVSLVSSSRGDYLVTSNQDLDNTQVLMTSVSAVQGLLLGLGGE
ncbi:MAG: hypothetical protein V7459_06885 [Oceanicoccus sp.]